MIPLHPNILPRLCPTCQVSSLDNTCWVCGANVNREELKGRVSIPNPAGPNSDGVDRALIL